MDNFYKEDDGYKKLDEKLVEIDFNLASDFHKVVGDAIQYGIKVLAKNLNIKGVE